ncbi:hypothetical protein MNBD_PLANCTO02-670 [hydrothermal vent metagenome]|uniref:Uncharacterized protein n=1 Tax=hydrothermal vent metagenome TaxID=652676 RepID=A0A3B1DX16_9ZZZZ
MTDFLFAKMSISDTAWVVVAVLCSLFFAVALIFNLAEYVQSVSGSIRRIVAGLVGIVFLLAGYYFLSGVLNLLGIVFLALGFVDAFFATFRKKVPTEKNKKQIEGMKFR